VSRAVDYRVIHRVAPGATMFPRHLTLTLEHNPHKSVCQPLDEYLANNDVTFETAAERDTALAEDSLWVLQWYPDTPVGFLAVAAADPLRLFKFAWRVGDADDAANTTSGQSQAESITLRRER
jgi:hypothetical protein